MQHTLIALCALLCTASIIAITTTDDCEQKFHECIASCDLNDTKMTCHDQCATNFGAGGACQLNEGLKEL